MSKNSQKLTICLESVRKDFLGLYDIIALINHKPYSYVLNSEYIVRKVQDLIKRHRPGKALQLLKKSNIKSKESEE